MIRVNNSLIPKRVMGRCLEGRRPVTKPRGRWEDAVMRDAVDFFQVRKWKAAVRNGEILRLKTG